MLWLTTIGHDNEHFLHWLVGDHNLLGNSGSALTTSPEKCERLLQLKEFETWRIKPHSVLWLYGIGKSMAIWWFWLEHSSDPTCSWKRENNSVVSL